MRRSHTETTTTTKDDDVTDADDGPASRSELTTALGKVALRALVDHGYLTYEQLTEVRPSDLLEIHGVGAKAIRILTIELAERGLGFRSD